MILTEKEASGKICPFIKKSDQSESGIKVNIHGSEILLENITCICSRCMAWEYVGEDGEPKKGFCKKLEFSYS